MHIYTSIIKRNATVVGLIMTQELLQKKVFFSEKCACSSFFFYIPRCYSTLGLFSALKCTVWPVYGVQKEKKMDTV